VVAKKAKSTGPAPGVQWLDAAEEHDYPAAASYLGLVAGAEVVDALVAAFRSADVVRYKAKDILRAARLPLLERTNPHVASDLGKIAAGAALSPILLVRGDLASDRRLQIADGYHRVCACYLTDENDDIPCIVVDL
jgi:hypothetical protein